MYPSCEVRMEKTLRKFAHYLLSDLHPKNYLSPRPKLDVRFLLLLIKPQQYTTCNFCIPQSINGKRTLASNTHS
uniref:Uncharacterized protein n=1 Tax=Hyaloperonospora arabidopsidis (strain Emoy2) TaxID=559515 RepID=M4C0X6_HYAAE